MKSNLLRLIAEVIDATERFELEKIHLQHEIYKTMLQYNINTKTNVNHINEMYENIISNRHPFIEILKKGDENEFVEWLHSGEDLGEQKENIYRDILLPEIIKYERYSWVKHLNL